MTSPQEQQFGKYRIEAEIGRGGFGVVYRAIDSTLDRPVALKILDPMLSRDAEWARRFQQEARVMARLDHPHIVPIYETGNEAGRVYIAMKLIEGGSLATRIGQGGPLPWNAAVRIIREIAGALDYAHEHGIIHRDLKPGNILLGAGGAVLTDFGLAQLVGESTLNPTLSGGMVGTWAYIAPEIWNGDKPNEGADIYALGCILYEMVTGQVLFGGENVAAIIGGHHKPLVLPQRWPVAVPDGLPRILHRALHHDPGSRYDSAGVMADELRQLTAPTMPPKVSLPVSQGWVGVALVVFVVLILAAGLLRGQRNLSSNQNENSPIAASFSTIIPTGLPRLALVPSSTNANVTVIPTPTAPSSLTPTPEQSQAPTLTPIPTITSIAPLRLGDTMIRQKDGMEMVYVPSGTFMMGSDPSLDDDADDDEFPQHAVTLSDFWLDRTEVTNAMYMACVTAGECVASNYANDINYNGVNYPAVGIPWHDAKAYCEWAGGQLPSEAQWEYAARGPDGRLYPWGNEAPNCNQAWFKDCGNFPVVVGSFPDGNSWVGAADMAGNVWEWVADWYDRDYYETFPILSENPTGPPSGDSKILRGGSWYSPPVCLRVAHRRCLHLGSRNVVSIGIRCVVPTGN